MKMKRNDLIVINNLVRAGIEDYCEGIDKYIIEFNKKEKALFVEQFDPNGVYAILLRKEMENITKDELIPINNIKYFGNMLSKIIKDDEIDLFVEDNVVIIKTSKGDIKMICFEEDDDEKESREIVKNVFKTRKYGNANNIVTFYERINKDDPNPDARCEIDLEKLGKEIFVYDEETKEIGAFKDTFYIRINNDDYCSIIRKEDDKDLMNIIGECTIFIDDIDCLLSLSIFSGFVNIHMKKKFPLVIIKEIPEHKIGVNYIISIKE